MLRIHRFSVILMIALSVSSAFAQKQYKPLRGYLKAKNGTEAMKEVEKLEKDSILGADPKLYEYGRQAQVLINDAENVKAYLKQAYDTTRFFNSIYKIYEYVQKCDRAELAILAESGKSPKYAKQNRQVLHQYYKNLGAGGRYFYARGKYKEAMSLMAYYLDVPLMPIWGADKSVVGQRDYVANAYIYQNSAFMSGEFASVEKYKDFTLADTALRRNVFELLAKAAEQTGDSLRMEEYLKQGLTDYPTDIYFFTRLTDYFAGRGEYAKSLTLADSLLARYPDNLLYMASRTISLMNLQRYEEAIEMGKQCLAIDSTIVDLQYYIGAAYCNLANEIKLPTNINSQTYRKNSKLQKDYYSAARPYIEAYRKKSPDEKAKWAPLLYRIYWTLNLGSQFEEIEAIVNMLEKQ